MGRGYVFCFINELKWLLERSEKCLSVRNTSRESGGAGPASCSCELVKQLICWGAAAAVADVMCGRYCAGVYHGRVIRPVEGRALCSAE